MFAGGWELMSMEYVCGMTAMLLKQVFYRFIIKVYGNFFGKKREKDAVHLDVFCVSSPKIGIDV